MARTRTTPLSLLLLALLAAALVAPTASAETGATGAAGGPAARAVHTARAERGDGLPTKQEWLRDVDRALRGSGTYLDRRAARRADGERLAVVLDIDNTSLASYYAWPRPVRRTLAFARRAVADGMTVFFATGRSPRQVPDARRALRDAGYQFAGICPRRTHRVPLQQAKVRCRTSFEDRGYTIVAVVGNRLTDLRGGHGERRFKLPSYGRLG